MLLAIVCSIVACAGPPPRPKPAAPVPPTHLQIVHAMKTPQRRELVERFGKRNGGAETWRVNEEALGTSLTVIDPFTGFLRRARRKPSAMSKTKPSMPLSDEQAASAARAFVRRNADLFGLPRHVVVGLGERVRSVEPSDHASPNAMYAVHFDASFATKGYEAFHEIDNSADLDVFVDDDGEVSSFVNLSRVHPPIRIDTRPRLGEEDPRVVAQILGRSLLVLVDEGGDDRDARALLRLPVGQVRADDIMGLQLVIHESTGPELAGLTYRLAYVVEVGKSKSGGSPLSAPPIFFFRYVVDADTGEVIEDARAPIVPAVLPD